MSKKVGKKSKADRAAEREIRKIETKGNVRLRQTLATGLVALVIATGANLTDRLDDSGFSDTPDATSVCTIAFSNVENVLDLGIEDPRLLERVNSEKIDAICGSENAIASDIESSRRVSRPDIRS